MPAAAPEAIEVLRRFVNTLDVESGRDRLDTPAALLEWLVAEGLANPADRADRADLAAAIALREALRDLGTANNEGTADPDAVAAVNRIAAGLPVAFHLHLDGGAHLEPQQGGIPGGLAGLLSIVFAAALDGTWQRFKACRNDECSWAFYDTSKNRSKRWCSMEACGNVANARAYRSRQRRGPGDHAGGDHR